jgi:hypothetical protein
VELASAADFDIDGDVDGRDFLAWQRGESPSPWSGSDLAAWQTQYGSPPLVSALRLLPSALSVAVPEPGALTLMAFLALGVAIRRDTDFVKCKPHELEQIT